MNIPKNIEKIEKETFRDCINMKNLFLKEGLKYIEEDAFKGDINLNMVALPDSF